MRSGATRTRGNRRVLSARAAVMVTGAFTLLAGTAVAAAPAAAGTEDRLRRDVREIERLGVAGVIAEARTPDGRFTARAGVADRRTGRPARPGDHFRGASVTKTYVATVVLQLIGEGRLSLDDTVDEWLPGLVRGNGNDGRRITIRHMLQHTSGLYDYVRDIAVLQSAEGYRERRFDRYTPERLVAIALEHEPDFEPGAANPDGTPKWNYSNTGYVLLGMIIKRVTGKDWRTQARDRVIRPLGLRDTRFPVHRATLPRPFLRGYHQYAADGPLTDTTLLDPSVAGASGALITTVADDNRFFRALIGGRLVPRALFTEMQRTVPTGWDGAYEGSRYGLGLFWFPLRCDGAGYWAHNGDMLGYMVREGVRTDGGRSVSIAMSSQLAGDRAERQNMAAAEAVRNALC